MEIQTEVNQTTSWWWFLSLWKSDIYKVYWKIATGFQIYLKAAMSTEKSYKVCSVCLPCLCVCLVRNWSSCCDGTHGGHLLDIEHEPETHPAFKRTQHCSVKHCNELVACLAQNHKHIPPKTNTANVTCVLSFCDEITCEHNNATHNKPIIYHPLLCQNVCPFTQNTRTKCYKPHFRMYLTTNCAQ